MIAEMVSPEEYNKAVHDYEAVFNDIRFCELNADKVDKIIYLLIKKDDSLRFGICLGIQNGIAKCPFSAPFGFPIALKEKLMTKDYDEAVEAIDNYLIKNSIKEIKFIFPPFFYNKQHLSVWINSFNRFGYDIIYIDINYSLHLSDIRLDNYEAIIHYNARKNLRIALKADLVLRECKNQDEIIEAYQIIAENRVAKGYPLKMTCKQILDTIEIVPYNVFMITKGEKNIAAAFIYQVTKEIVQVIYWGDKIEYRDVKPINFLAYELIKYYKRKEIKYMDIGPSTENGMPNYGLCDFKESIGCQLDLKFALAKTFI